MTQFKPDELMLQNYIQNKLSPKDTEQLELWLADHPEVMQDLELDIMFSQSKAAFKQAEQPKQTKSFSFWDFFTSKKLIPINVLAYGMALMFVFNTFINNSLNNEFSEISFVDLGKKRGSEAKEYSLTHNEKNGMAVRFYPDSSDELYKVSMKSIGSDEEKTFEGLKADESGHITVMLQSNQIKNNQWQVLIYNSRDQLEQNYLINIK